MRIFQFNLERGKEIITEGRGTEQTGSCMEVGGEKRNRVRCGWQKRSENINRINGKNTGGVDVGESSRKHQRPGR